MSQLTTIIRSDTNIITQEEWKTMNTSIKDTAVNIAKSIEAAHVKIAKAKKLAEDAPNIKGGLLGIGKQKKVNAALSESQVITNEAVTDLSELIQQSIRFTLQSVKTASDMQKALAYLAVNGIRDVNGRVETLSTECADSINTIIETAQDFLYQQAEFSERIEEQAAKDKEQDMALKSMEKALRHFSANSIRQEQWLSDLQILIEKNQSEEEQNRKKLELLIEENKSSFEILHEAVSNYQSKNNERIMELDNTFREIIESNRKLDQEERNRLRDEYFANVQKLKMTLTIASCSIGVIAVAALILSIVL